MNMILKISYSKMQKLILGGHGTPYDSALEIVLITDVKCITILQQCSSNLWPFSLKAKRNCIVANRSKLLN
jgi:hypothetical protein